MTTATTAAATSTTPAEVDARLEALVDSELKTLSAMRLPGTPAPEPAVETEKPEAPAADEPAEQVEAKETSTPEAETPKETPEAPTKFTAEEYRKALTALRFEPGLPEAALKGLTPDQVTEWGLELRKAQIDRDRRLEDAAESKKKLEELQSQRGATAPGERFAAPTSAPDFATETKELAGQLGLDSDGQAALGKVLARVASAARESVDSELKELRATVDSVRGAQESTLVDKAQAWLAERIPQLTEQLADRATLMDVLKEAGALAQARGAKDPAAQQAALIDAARARFFDTLTKAPAPEKDEALARARKNGLPSTSSRRTTPKVLTGDERETAIVEGLLAGQKPDEIRARYLT